MRWAIYNAARAFLLGIVQHADEPNLDILDAFLVALNTTEFLFKLEVKERLLEIWKKSCDFFATAGDMKHLYQKTGSYGPDNIGKL